MSATKETVQTTLAQRASSAISALQNLHNNGHAFIVEGSLVVFKEEENCQLGIKLDDK